MCDTEGIPKPEVTWERDGVEIPSSGPNYMMHRSGSLHFSPVDVEDSGEYRCTATNEAGSVSRDFSLSVQGISSSFRSIIQSPNKPFSTFPMQLLRRSYFQLHPDHSCLPISYHCAQPFLCFNSCLFCLPPSLEVEGAWRGLSAWQGQIIGRIPLFGHVTNKMRDALQMCFVTVLVLFSCHWIGGNTSQ